MPAAVRLADQHAWAGLCPPNGCRGFRLVGVGMPYIYAVSASNTEYNDFYHQPSDIFQFDLKP